MAKRRKSKRRGATTKCKIVTVCGRRRRICWGKTGIKSNTPAGGGGGTMKRARRKSGKKRRCRFGVNKNTGACRKRKRAS